MSTLVLRPLAVALVSTALVTACSGDEREDSGTARAEPPTSTRPESTSPPTTLPETSVTSAGRTVAPTTAGQATGEAKVAAPEYFTACVFPGPPVTSGTDERIKVSLTDGTMTVERRRGWTWRQVVGKVSDPRLDGAWYQSWDGDEYTLPGEPGPRISAVTFRAENDEGAWQGSSVSIEFPDGTVMSAPLVMIGEGAYQGLTAVLGGEGCFQGYIIEVPAPPVPNTG